MNRELPRLMIAAPGSGSGKTTLTCGLLQAWKNRGVPVRSFKCCPDYIDPMFHTEVIGIPSRNLDLFFLGKDTVCRLLAKNTPPDGLALLEGVMGYYDGMGDSETAGSYDLARQTETPVILVTGCKGQALSVAAEVEGFRSFRKDSGIQGVILNQIKPVMYPFYQKMIERETGIKVYGYLPPLPEVALESRHLGLVTAQEVGGLREKLQLLAQQMEESVDIRGLLELAASALPLRWQQEETNPKIVQKPLRVAVAKDRAFCFYYADALDLLQEMGAELVEFSPISDTALPEGTCGLLLGGGYPELYAAQLSENTEMKEVVYRAIADGMPCVAECGGFLYLHKTLWDDRGNSYPMVGAVDAEAKPTGSLKRFGYVKLTAKQDNLLCKKGESFPAHEFHYWDSTDSGDGFHAEKAGGKRSWECAVATDSFYAGYPHFHFCSEPRLAQSFLEKCAAYRDSRCEI